MAFSERTKTIALAIVKIFETSKPFGHYEAVAVLDDGAGISYGVSQFTHKSGSLHAVLQRYLKLTGTLPGVVADALNDFRSAKNITSRSKDEALKAALRKLGKTPEMQQAQREIAVENYLRPALKACEGSGFVAPLSLAVIYDSMNHGSYAKIRDRVKVSSKFEKEWITQYCRLRDAWLESVLRLAKTAYRTDFFLKQIGRDNWNLDLPLNVHGYKLTEAILFPKVSAAAPLQKTEPASGAEVDKGSAANSLRSEDSNPSNQPPPIDSQEHSNGKEIKAELTPEGGIKIESTENSPGPKERIAVVKTKPKSWASQVGTKITAAVTGNALFQWIQAQLDSIQSLGLPRQFWLTISIIVGVGSLIWIADTIWDVRQENKRQKEIDDLLVKENSTENNLVQLIPHDEAELYRAKKFKIITRGE